MNEITKQVEIEIANAREQLDYDDSLVVAYLKGALIYERVENKKLRGLIDRFKKDIFNLKKTGG